jgi:hypothetical protein
MVASRANITIGGGSKGDFLVRIANSPEDQRLAHRAAETKKRLAIFAAK